MSFGAYLQVARGMFIQRKGAGSFGVRHTWILGSNYSSTSMTLADLSGYIISLSFQFPHL